MTIVIAKKIDEEVMILSDTKVLISPDRNVPEHRCGVRASPEQGVLKSIVIHPWICISYAGETKAACESIAALIKILEKETLDRNQIVDFMTKKHRDSDQVADFIVCFKEEHRKSIVRISGGRCEDDLLDAWIGDKQAFEKFQSILHGDGQGEQDGKEKFYRSFDWLVRENSSSEIGDFVIGVNCGRDGIFSYRESIFMEHEFKVTQECEDAEFFEVPTGSPECGSYSEVILVSNYTPVVNKYLKPAVALYFRHGRFGILFKPEAVLCNEGRGVVISDVDSHEFVQVVNEKYERFLSGPYVDGVKVYPSFYRIGVSVYSR